MGTKMSWCDNWQKTKKHSTSVFITSYSVSSQFANGGQAKEVKVCMGCGYLQLLLWLQEIFPILLSVKK